MKSDRAVPIIARNRDRTTMPQRYRFIERSLPLKKETRACLGLGDARGLLRNAAPAPIPLHEDIRNAIRTADVLTFGLPLDHGPTDDHGSLTVDAHFQVIEVHGLKLERTGLPFVE